MKTKRIICLILAAAMLLTLFAACKPNTPDDPDNPDKPTDPSKLGIPFVTVDDDGLASWAAIANASKYAYKINGGEEKETAATSVQLNGGDSIVVKAVGDGTNYADSDYCSAVVYPEPKTVEGEYVLESAMLRGQDKTSLFQMYNVTFTKINMRVYIQFDTDIVVSRNNSSYKISGNKLTETTAWDSEVFNYVLDGEKIKTLYIDGDDEYEITLKKKPEEIIVENWVDFESVLFGESLTDTKKFNYCPAILMEKDGDGKDVMNIWYCTNKNSGVIMDHIGYRTGVQREDGKWLFSEEQIVLAPTVDTWDGRHTCDPAVIKGEFKLKGKTYNYLMSYLGCTTEDYQKNETGLAVAEKVGGPWIKVDGLNPIVPWYDDGDEAAEEAKYQGMIGTNSIYWGTGMPALISVDGKGEVLMFYASTLRGIGVRRYDFSDLDDPKLKFTSSLAHKGVLNSQNRSCRIGIPDFAYDPVQKRLYCASVTNERNPADVTLTRVNSHSMLLYVDGLNDMEEVCSAMQSGDYQWNIVGYVGPDVTEWERNHNPGLVRDVRGFIPDPAKVGMVVSTGHNSWANENIFTYRLFGHWFDID